MKILTQLDTPLLYFLTFNLRLSDLTTTTATTTAILIWVIH